MRFRNRNDFLLYLVRLSDSDQSWKLNVGKNVLDGLIQEGFVEPGHSDYDELARMLFGLRDEGSISFTDHDELVRGQANPGYNALLQAAQISVTGQGRIAAKSSVPALFINQLAIGGNIENFNLGVLIEQMELEIDRMDAPEEEKAEARGRLARARAAVGDVATGMTSELLFTAFRRILGL